MSDITEALDRLGEAQMAAIDAMREKVAMWMIANGFATGHGDTLNDLLTELTWQVEELKKRAREPSTPAPGRIEVLEAALREIARQNTFDELLEASGEDGVDMADFEGGYDACVLRARAALSPNGAAK